MFYPPLCYICRTLCLIFCIISAASPSFPFQDDTPSNHESGSECAADTHPSFDFNSASSINRSDDVPALETYQHPKENYRRFHVGRPIVDCPEPQERFSQSRCVRPTAQAYAIRCYDLDHPNEMHTTDGRCLPNEICVETWSVDTTISWVGVSTAWCVLEFKMTQIRNREIGKPFRIEERYYPTPWARRMATKVLVTDETGTMTVKTMSLSIAAQSVRRLFDAVSYTTLESGLNACAYCSNVGLDPLPAADSILVKVSLPAGVASVNIYLADFSNR